MTETAIDKGGNTNLIKQRIGPPAAYIVHRCWVAFENCRPGEAAASENGPFVSFVNSVHEYATGKTEENSTLPNWIKKLAELLRRHDLLLQKLGALETKLENLKAEPVTLRSNAAIVELEAEIKIAKHEVVDAILATIPTNQRFKQNTGRA